MEVSFLFYWKEKTSIWFLPNNLFTKHLSWYVSIIQTCLITKEDSCSMLIGITLKIFPETFFNNFFELQYSQRTIQSSGISFLPTTLLIILNTKTRKHKCIKRKVDIIVLFFLAILQYSHSDNFSPLASQTFSDCWVAKT